jgi:hypothetical protein
MQFTILGLKSKNFFIIKNRMTMLLYLLLGVKGDHIGGVCTLNFKEFFRNKKMGRDCS